LCSGGEALAASFRIRRRMRAGAFILVLTDHLKIYNLCKSIYWYDEKEIRVSMHTNQGLEAKASFDQNI